MAPGRPKGTTSPNARRNGIRIPLDDGEKAFLESVAHIMATKSDQPQLGVTTVLRWFLLSGAKRYIQTLTPENNMGMDFIADLMPEKTEAKDEDKQ